MSFTEDTVSDAKRLVRADFYLNALRELGGGGVPRFLILAGMAPEGEINCIRCLFPQSTIVACDTDEVAVMAAWDAGADEVHEGDITHIDSVARGKYFEVINADFCSQVGDQTLGALVRAVSKASLLVSFCSYGREDSMAYFEHEASDKESKREWRKNFPVAVSLPASVRGRVIAMWRAVAQSGTVTCEVKRIYLYKGKIPMMGIVFSRSPGPRWDPFILHATNPDLRATVLRDARFRSNDWLTDVYAVRTNRIAAWKAVQTRSQK